MANKDAPAGRSDRRLRDGDGGRSGADRPVEHRVRRRGWQALQAALATTRSTPSSRSTASPANRPTTTTGLDRDPLLQPRNPPAATASSSGRAAARSVHDDFTVVKPLDSPRPRWPSTPATAGASSVTLDLCRADAVGTRFMRYRLGNVIVTGLVVEGTAGDGMPAETVSFDYSKIHWTCTDVNAAGTSIGSTSASWDLVVRKTSAAGRGRRPFRAGPGAAESAGLGTQVVADPGADALLAAMAAGSFEAI